MPSALPDPAARDVALISIDAVSKAYETREGPVQALNPTSLFIPDGAFVSIVGPSGCGKTTLLKMIGGLLPVTGGQIKVRGQPVLGPRDDISFVFQSAVLLPWKTALENVLLPIRVRKKVSDEEMQRALDLLKLVGLRNFEKRYPFELSGGMQQRVSICRALIQDPACLLLDEPFGALDALTRENMNVFFNGLWRQTGKTVVMVTHSIQEAVFLSNRVIVMSDRPGRIIDDVACPFPDERDPKLIGSADFGAITDRIRQYFTNSGLD